MERAAWFRSYFQDISGSRQVAAADSGNITLKAARTGHTHFIQRVIVYITTDFAASMVFRDDNGTPVKVCEVPASPGDETRWDFDFGERGMPLTEAKAFILALSGAGLAGHVEWQGYCKQSSTMTADAFAAS